MNKHNHIAIWAMIIVHQVLGFLWYGVLFMKIWLEGQGKTVDQVNQSNPMPFIWDIVTTIAAAYTISWVVRKAGATTFQKGVIVGLILFAGIVCQTLVSHYKFLGINDSVLLVDLSFSLVWLVLTAGLLAAWKKNDMD